MIFTWYRHTYREGYAKPHYIHIWGKLEIVGEQPHPPATEFDIFALCIKINLNVNDFLQVDFSSRWFRILGHTLVQFVIVIWGQVLFELNEFDIYTWIFTKKFCMLVIKYISSSNVPISSYNILAYRIFQCKFWE